MRMTGSRMKVRTERPMMAIQIPIGRSKKPKQGHLACITRRIFVRLSMISQVLRTENMQD